MYPTYQNKIKKLESEIENYKNELKKQEVSFNTILEDESGSVIFLSVLSDRIELIKEKIKNKEKELNDIKLMLSN